MDKLTLELSIQDAGFLSEELQRHIRHRDSELVHTDAKDLQHAIAIDVSRLNTIQDRLKGLLAASK